MSVIAPLLFTAICLLAVASITYGLAQSLPRILKIVRQANGGHAGRTERRITVKIPLHAQDNVVQMPPRIVPAAQRHVRLAA